MHVMCTAGVCVCVWGKSHSAVGYLQCEVLMSVTVCCVSACVLLLCSDVGQSCHSVEYFILSAFGSEGWW